jgi:3-oxosteroid 1-dehydrogenase
MAGFDESFDFVVVGSGGGSMCAALRMRAAGKSVLILEKEDLVGGTTAKSGGVMWIPNNRFMQRDGVPDSPEAAMAYLDSVVGDHNDTPGASRERRAAYVAEAPRMIDFLVEQGIELTRISYYPDYYDERPGGSERGRTVVAKLFDLNELGPWKARLRPGMLPYAAMLEEAFHMPTFNRSWKGKRVLATVLLRGFLAKLRGRQYATAGQALQGRMLKAALAARVEIRTGAAVRELLVEDGRATGVVTTKDGRPWRVGARLGVLVNAGGFARNQRMRDAYQPGTRVEWTRVAPGDTGEMIEEMMRHGAAIAQMTEMVGFQMTTPPHTDNEALAGMQSTTASPHAILVDQRGRRYMNEGGSYMAYCQAMLESPERSPSWAIFDDQHIRRYMLATTMPGRRKPQSWQDEGFLRSADSIEGLAAKIEVDPAVLRATVERFNGFVAKGRDEDFGRGDRAYDRWLGDAYHPVAPNLGTIAKAPFYALPVYPGDVGTYGGVVTDAQARVLREDGSAIEGLYATGVSTASVMGRTYPGAGSSVGPSFTWGYVAAGHAAGS